MHTINADTLNTLAEVAQLEALVSDTQTGTTGPSAEHDDVDDGVEALIIPMDRNTAEHLFLQAQRDIRRDAARALLETDH